MYFEIVFEKRKQQEGKCEKYFLGSIIHRIFGWIGYGVRSDYFLVPVCRTDQMVVPFNKLRNSEGQGQGQKSRVQNSFELCMRHPSGDSKLTVGYVILTLRSKVSIIKEILRKPYIDSKMIQSHRQTELQRQGQMYRHVYADVKRNYKYDLRFMVPNILRILH